MLAFGRVLSCEEIIEKVDCLSVAAIRDAGAAALRSPPTVAAIGPIAKVYSPDRVSERLGSL